MLKDSLLAALYQESKKAVNSNVVRGAVDAGYPGAGFKTTYCSLMRTETITNTFCANLTVKRSYDLMSPVTGSK